MNPHSQDDPVYNEKFLFLLMDVVNTNGSVNRLTREGLTYVDVAKITDDTIRKGLVQTGDGKLLQLTRAGIILLERLRPKFKNTNKEEWIDVASKFKIGKLDKNVIFVPNQNELTFKLD